MTASVSRKLRYHASVRWLYVLLPLTAGTLLGLVVEGPGPKPVLRFPSVDPTTSCGPVSLAVVSNWLGASREIDSINRLMNIGDSGASSLLDLRTAAKRMGYAAEAVHVDPRGPLPENIPLILHLHDNHFAAAIALGRTRLALVDPPAEARVLTLSQLRGDWGGVALLVARSESDLLAALADAGIPQPNVP